MLCVWAKDNTFEINNEQINTQISNTILLENDASKIVNLHR